LAQFAWRAVLANQALLLFHTLLILFLDNARSVPNL